MSNGQFILTLVGAILTSNVLTAFVTAYFVRPKTNAEARHELSQADKTDADAAGVYFGQSQVLFSEVKEMLSEVKGLHTDLMDCRRSEASKDIKIGELNSEVEHLERTLQIVRAENVEKDKRISEMLGEMN